MTKLETLGIVLICSVFIIFGVSRSGTFMTEVDVNSGLLRETHCISSCRLGQKTKTTAFSRLVEELGLAKQPPTWKRAWSQTVVPLGGRGFADYAHGFAVGNCAHLPLAFELFDTDEATKKRIVTQALKFLADGDRTGIMDLVSGLDPEKSPTNTPLATP